jgi:hypothetical protein
MIVELAGVYVESSLVAVIRESSLGSEQTVLFTAGQDSTTGGHLIDMPIDDVIERLQSIAHHELARQLLDEVDTESDV